MNTTKTVLMVAPYFPPHSGGLERYVDEVARGLHRQHDWRVVVLTTSESDKDEQEVHHGCTVYRLRVGHKISNTPFSFHWLRAVRRVLREVQPDIVNVHTPVPGLGDLVAWLLPRHIPLVVTYHADSMRKGSLLPDIVVWLYEHGPLRHLLRKAEQVVCASDFVRFDFLPRYLHKSSTICPAVAMEVFAPGMYAKDEHPTVLFVASIGKGEQYKGLDVLLRSLSILKKRVSNIQLRIVGSGNMCDAYKTLARELGVREHVVFTGALYGKELVAEYQRAHLFVLPTKKESFGMVIAEAMACGLPVVSTRVGGVQGLVEDGVTGFLVEPDDTQALAEKMHELLAHPKQAQAFGYAGRTKMERDFRWADRIVAYDAVFKQALNPKPHIAHIVSYYPPHVGGMEEVADNVAHECARRGYHTEVFATTLGARGVPRVERKSNFVLRRLRCVEFAHTPVAWSLPLRLLFLPKGTILHLHLAQAWVSEVALLVAKIRQLPIIAHFHLDVEPSGRLGWLFLLYKKYVLCRVLRAMDAVMVFSKEQADLVVTQHGVSREVIHYVSNAVRDEFFHTRKDTMPHTPLRVLTVSRLSIQKRVDRLIGAMALLEFPAELTIVGDGEDREELEELARKQCRAGTVHFVGKKTHHEIRAYHREADIFVIPSDKEGGMPLTALEAMAAGLPVVGSNLVGIRELVAGVGIVVDDPSPQTFAAALTKLHEEPSMLAKLSQQGNACAEQYTWQHAVDTIEKVYRSVQQLP